MARASKSLEEKVQDLDRVFFEEANKLDPAALENRMKLIARGRVENQLARAGDDELQQAKDKVTELNGPYSDVEKACKLKQELIHKLLEEKGK